MELDLKNRLAGDAQLLQYAPQIASLAAQILDAKVKELDPELVGQTLGARRDNRSLDKTQRRELEQLQRNSQYGRLLAGSTPIERTLLEGSLLKPGTVWLVRVDDFRIIVTAADAVVAD